METLHIFSPEQIKLLLVKSDLFGDPICHL